MPEFDFSGNFISSLNVKDGDICIITSNPTPEEKNNPLQKELKNGVMVNKTYWVLNIPVEVNKKSKIYTPDNKTGLRFVNEWGADYSLWVGKRFRVKIEQYNSFGQIKQRVVGYPIVENDG